jgi:hypothetical protein
MKSFYCVHQAQQAPSTLAGTRDASGLSGGAYSAADISKFRNDQNSSPVPSAINTQVCYFTFLI